MNLPVPLVVCAGFLALGAGHAHAQTGGAPPQLPPVASRYAVSGGLGVSYMKATDIVDLVNATPGIVERVSAFRASPEFFGSFTIPLSPDVGLKIEYAYALASFTPTTTYETAEYTLRAHLPSVIVQYVLADEGIYALKVGAGGGYHVGALDVRYSSLDRTYAATGPGFVLDLEGNTAFGEDLFAYLGGQLRAEWIGTLADEAGAPPTVTSPAPTMNWMGIGARLGFVYMF